MNMPSFNIRLCSPTSTSCTIHVAIKFSGENGIIIQLDNPKVVPYQALTGFNCMWLSRFKEEDERLFFGGERFIKLVSIRIKNTNENFEEFINVLCCFDVMLSGGTLDGYGKIKTKDVLLISDLMNNILGKVA
eukprot:57375_1